MDNKEKILKTSFNLFLEKGFTDVSINDVIKAVGLTKGGFYYYFESKEALLFEVIDKYLFSYLDARLMILREEDLRAAQMRNLADLAWILGKEQAEALRLDPVKAFKDLEPATQNYVGSFLYDAGHGPRYRGH